MKRLDLILIAGVLVLAGIIYLVFLGSAEDGGKAVITVDGQVVQDHALQQPIRSIVAICACPQVGPHVRPVALPCDRLAEYLPSLNVACRIITILA